MSVCIQISKGKLCLKHLCCYNSADIQVSLQINFFEVTLGPKLRLSIRHLMPKSRLKLSKIKTDFTLHCKGYLSRRDRKTVTLTLSLTLPEAGALLCSPKMQVVGRSSVSSLTMQDSCPALYMKTLVYL